MSTGLLAEWSQWMQAAGMSARTIADRVQLVARFEAQQDASSLAANWRDIAAFLACDRFSAGTRQTYYAHLRAWFHWLVLTDRRIDDPTAKVRAPKGPRRKPRPITVEQLGRILSTRMHRRTRAMVLLAAYEGFRVHEIAKMRGEDLRGGTLRVIGKGSVEWELPVHELVAELAAAMPVHGYWFPSHTRPGRPVTSKAVSAIMSDLMRRAGVPGTPHALRHFFGTEVLRSSGGNLVVTQQLMRHANVATTALYTQVEDAERRAAIAGLPTPLRVA